MFSKRLKYVRKLRNLSQEELGKKINATKSTISNYENEYSTPSNEVLKDLANILNTTTDYLLGRTDELDEETEGEKDLIINKISKEFPDAKLMFHDLANMTAEQLEEVYDFIKFKRSQNK